MLLNDLYDEIAKDFPINKGDLANESLKTTNLWIKYIKMWSQEKLKMEKMESGLAKLLSQKRDYYNGNQTAAQYQANPPYNGKTPRTEAGMQKLLEADTEVIKYKEGLIVQNNKVKVIEAALDECKRRGYSIKAAIDMVKFENGY